MKYIIYLHRNKINGKCYVGQTNQSLNNRFGKNGIKYATQPYFYGDIKNMAGIILNIYLQKKQLLKKKLIKKKSIGDYIIMLYILKDIV